MFFKKFFKKNNEKNKKDTESSDSGLVVDAPVLKTDKLFSDLSEDEKEYFRNEESSGYSLRIENGVRKGEVLPLIGLKITIGRSPECDISVPDPMISDRHLLLVLERGKNPCFQDLGSTNGTFLKGKKQSKGELSLGNQIRLGETLFNFEKDDHGIS